MRWWLATSPTRRVTGRAFSLQTSVMSGHLTQVGGRSRANTGIARKGPVTRRSKLELNHLEEEQVLSLLEVYCRWKLVEMERYMNVLHTNEKQVEKEAEKKPARKRGVALSTGALKERQVCCS